MAAFAVAAVALGAYFAAALRWPYPAAFSRPWRMDAVPRPAAARAAVVRAGVAGGAVSLLAYGWDASGLSSGGSYWSCLPPSCIMLGQIFTPDFAPAVAPSVDGRVWVLIALAAGVFLGSLLYARLRRPGQRRGSAELEPGVGRRYQSGSTIGSTEEIDPDGNPRTAVLQSYRAMEVAFARIGLARNASETSTEFARRLLSMDVGPPGAVAEMTRLFVFAGYASIEITEDMRRQAFMALTEVREALA